MSDLPDGKAWYAYQRADGDDDRPDAASRSTQIGLAEVKRIRGGDGRR